MKAQKLKTRQKSSDLKTDTCEKFPGNILKTGTASQELIETDRPCTAMWTYTSYFSTKRNDLTFINCCCQAYSCARCI